MPKQLSLVVAIIIQTNFKVYTAQQSNVTFKTSGNLSSGKLCEGEDMEPYIKLNEFSPTTVEINNRNDITFLRKSHFDCLPDDVRALTLLGLPLSFVEDGVFKNLSLVQLSMYFCEQHTIPYLEGVGKTLEVLSLNYNKIRSISAEDFMYCKVLHLLEIQWNQLSIFPDLHTVKNTLKHVNFANNFIKKFVDSVYMPVMRTLVMSYDNLEHLDMNRIYHMFPNMYSFDFAKNQIRNIEEFEDALCDTDEPWTLVCIQHVQ